jgi:(p)ppGpp synthase/HD superfamily hydrolase
MLSQVVEGLAEKEQGLIVQAFRRASIAFSGILRRSGKPFLDHLLETAVILRKVMGIRDSVLLAAGLLHDILEDTPVTKEELKNEFGCEVADLVDAESKLSKELLQGEQREVESLKKWIRALAKDPRVGLLKAADNLSNMGDQEVFPEEKRIEHALETIEIYVPIMDAMGLWEMRERLGNAAIKYLDPDKYAAALKEYAEAIGRTTGRFNDLQLGISSVLRGKGVCELRVESRRRSLYEIFRKMEKEGKSLDEYLTENPLMLNYMLVEIGDNEAMDSYSAMKVLRAGEQGMLAGFKPCDEIIVDWISPPRPDGYQALHTFLNKEGMPGKLLILVTSREMGDRNRLGFATAGGAEPLDPDWYKRDFDFLAKLMGRVEKIGSTREARSVINEVSYQTYVYTEDEVKIWVSIGSTVLDFAIAKHAENPERAFRAVSAKVNGNEVGLNYLVRRGDKVEIIYGEEDQIEPLWISWAMTTDAAERIKEYLQSKDTKWQVQKAIDSINKIAAKDHISYINLEQVTWMKEFLEILNQKLDLRLQDAPDLIMSVGRGEVDPVEMMKIFMGYYNGIMKERMADPAQHARSYVIKLEVPNEPGVLGRITGKLKEFGINIERDVSSPVGEGSVIAFVASIYSSIQRDQIENALKELESDYRKQQKNFVVIGHYYLLDKKLKRFNAAVKHALKVI